MISQEVAERAPLHPSLQWRLHLDPTGSAHRAHPRWPRRRTACGAIGRLLVTGKDSPRCETCFPEG